MNEQEWLTSEDPAAMLCTVRREHEKGLSNVAKVSDRKLRLFACACFRLNADHAANSFCAEQLGVAVACEEWADGGPRPIPDEDKVRYVLYGTAELAARRMAEGGRREFATILRDIVGNPFRQVTLPKYFEEGDWVEAIPPYALDSGSGRHLGAVVVSTNPFVLVSDGGDMLWASTAKPEKVRRMGRARFQKQARERWQREKRRYPPLAESPVGPPVWMTWRDGTVPKTAKTIYEDRAFDQLPVLADALEDAGCPEQEVIDHCRSEGPHVRGCWVVDLILGKE
jgi:hypothetical protein